MFQRRSFVKCRFYVLSYLFHLFFIISHTFLYCFPLLSLFLLTPLSLCFCSRVDVLSHQGILERRICLGQCLHLGCDVLLRLMLLFPTHPPEAATSLVGEGRPALSEVTVFICHSPFSLTFFSFIKGAKLWTENIQ